MKRIYLRQSKAGGCLIYIVTKLVNDIKYKIGDRLTHDLVRDLCDQSGTWTVTITDGK